MNLFREAGAADARAVVALWQACGMTRPWNDPCKDFFFALGSGGAAVLVHERQGRIAATAMARQDGQRGMLHYVAVAPELQRQGLGMAAVRAAEAWLAKRGVCTANLLVRAEDEGLAAFYETLGYEVNPVLCMARKIIAA